MKLFHSIKPLFAGKPLIVVVNKIDVVRPENVVPEDWALVQNLADPARGGIGGVQIVTMSTLTDEGISTVKQIVYSLDLFFSLIPLIFLTFFFRRAMPCWSTEWRRN